MKLLRLRITDYRGVEKCEVDFAATGITLISGPNEAGKTCSIVWTRAAIRT